MMNATIRNRAGERVRREYDGKVTRSSDQRDAPRGTHIDTYTRPFAEQLQYDDETLRREVNTQELRRFIVRASVSLFGAILIVMLAVTAIREMM